MKKNYNIIRASPFQDQFFCIELVAYNAKEISDIFEVIRSICRTTIDHLY